MDKQTITNPKTDLVIVQLDRALVALSEANTIQDTKKILDVAAAAKIYAQRQKMGQESIDYAHRIKIEALAQIGRMIHAGQEAGEIRTQGQPKKTTQGEEYFALKPVTDYVDHKTSALAQKLATLPDELFEEVKAGAMAMTAALREVRQADKKTAPDLPGNTYRVIYADPPWNYGNSGLQQYGHASHHYPAMSIDELCALPVMDIADKNAVLFLWVTSPLLEECFPVIKAWGFKYKTSFVWDKVKHNMGHYNSVRHELLLVCTRGSCTPDVTKLFDSVQSIERTKKHSEKPEMFRTIIDTIYTNGKKLELFRRGNAPAGWDIWGNESDTT